MNINAVRLVSVGVITGFVIWYKDSRYLCFSLNARPLILLSLATTYYCSYLILYYLLCNTQKHKPVGVYASPHQWNSIMGDNYTGGSSHKLW